ncbi:MAG: lycopene cyclase domain-containing protein [Candidatus Diapherotrites archaeon]|uniref:Lycopene cyclase domain-containing protein n=1 Tax=Candidatus Iainarchaeum sp. TaxID=3101447 RepID=A0A8T4CAC9_9ARCH|nr:lycopene cyclase domain-containing protein [Candidatus Diapherotrites archaeon]
MMEYTISTIIGFVIVLFLDRILLRTKIIGFSPRMVYTTVVFIVFQLFFDNYFTQQGLWSFNSAETLGVLVPFVPIENIFFGIEMLWFALILFSFFSRE